MAKSKNTTSHRKQVAAFGAAMGTLAVGQAPPAQAAVINLQSAGIGNILIPFNSTISYGNVPATLETIGGIDVLGFEGGTSISRSHNTGVALPLARALEASSHSFRRPTRSPLAASLGPTIVVGLSRARSPWDSRATSASGQANLVGSR